MKTETLEVAGGYIVSAFIDDVLTVKSYYPSAPTTCKEIIKRFKTEHKPISITNKFIKQTF